MPKATEDMNFQDLPYVPYNISLLIIPLTAFAFIFVFLANSLKSKKEILACTISQKLREKFDETSNEHLKEELGEYKDVLLNYDNLKKLRVRDLERIEKDYHLIRYFARKYDMGKISMSSWYDKDACGTFGKKRDKPT